jgi:hypothetical protein
MHTHLNLHLPLLTLVLLGMAGAFLTGLGWGASVVAGICAAILAALFVVGAWHLRDLRRTARWNAGERLR